MSDAHPRTCLVLSVWSRQGLGTSTAKEAKEYFAALDTHQLEFEWKDDKRDDDLIDMAFSKKRGIIVERSPKRGVGSRSLFVVRYSTRVFTEGIFPTRMAYVPTGILHPRQ